MGKVVKKVGKAALIGAAVGAITVATGGLGGLVAPGAFLGVGGSIAAASGVGFAVTASSLAIVGAVGGAAIFGGLAALSSAARAFAKKPNMDVSSASDALQRLRMSIDPDAVSKLVFGTTALGADIVYAEKINEDKVLYIVELAGHEIDSITGFWVNDESVAFSGNAAVGDWAGILWRYVNLGTEDQTYRTGFGADWPSTARGRGRAHMALVWDLKVGKDKLAGGIPTRITTQGRAALCYDPRKDTTVGGSGSHRADDQGTWEHTSNWALIVLTYLLGWRSNGELAIGMGESPDDIDYDSWIAMANVCEEALDGTFRYLVDGMFSATNEHDNLLSQFEAAINGHVAKVGGKWYAWVPHDDLTPAGTITEADLVRQVGVTFSPSGDVSDLYNTGRGRYISPALLYQTDFYPEVVEASAVAEDGGPRILAADYSIIQQASRAERVTRTKVRRSRFTASWAFAMSMKGLLYRPFSVVTLNIRETNYEDVTVRVLDMQSDWKTGIVAMTVIEEDASIYDDTIPLGTPVTQLDPSTYDPAAAIAVSGLGVSDMPVTGDSGTAKNYLLVSWDDPGGFVRNTEIQYRTAAGPGATQNGAPLEIDLTQSLVGPVEQTTVYEVRARHITRFGVIGPWSSWKEETSGDNETTGTASSVPWTGVTNPDGTRPENNATKNTNPDNIIRNPGAEDGVLSPHFALASSGGVWSALNGVANSGAWCFLYQPPGGGLATSAYLWLNHETIPADVGDQFSFVAADRAGASGTINQVQLVIRWVNSVGTTVSEETSTLRFSTTSYQKLEASGTCPAGAIGARLLLRVFPNSGTANTHWDSILCIQKRGPEGLLDGAVTTAKLVDLAITETKIADDSISTPKLQANSVTANEIMANTITASKFLTDEGVDLAGIVPGQLNGHYEDGYATQQTMSLSESGKFPSNPVNVSIDGHRVKVRWAFQTSGTAPNPTVTGWTAKLYVRTNGGSWSEVDTAGGTASNFGWVTHTEYWGVADEFNFPAGNTLEFAVAYFKGSPNDTYDVYIRNIEIDIITEFFK